MRARFHACAGEVLGEERVDEAGVLADAVERGQGDGGFTRCVRPSRMTARATRRRDVGQKLSLRQDEGEDGGDSAGARRLRRRWMTRG